MKILYHNRSKVADADVVRAEYCAELDDLLARSDVVALHCPGGPATFRMMDGGRFDCMKKSAFLINTSRGDVVDQDALIKALQEGQIAGAGLDVYVGEPSVPEALLGMDNVVLLPHLGSATVETRTAMGLRVLDNLQAFFAGREPGDRIA